MINFVYTNVYGKGFTHKSKTKYFNTKYSQSTVFTLLLAQYYTLGEKGSGMQCKPTMVHWSVNQVSVVSMASVPSSQRQRRQSPCLRVVIHALYDQHVVLQMLATIGMPWLSPLTASRHTLQVTAYKLDTFLLKTMLSLT